MSAKRGLRIFPSVAIIWTPGRGPRLRFSLTAVPTRRARKAAR